jgi:GNAT superfamily N-acetyltransferase
MADVRRWSVDEVHAHDDALRGVYAAAYAEAPYDKGPAEADQFLLRLHDQTGLPGFTFVAASVDAAPVGFAFGRHMEPGRWWYGAEAMPPDALIDAEKYAVSELAVAPAHRGQGLSRRLLDELLRDRPEPYAILLSRPGSLARTLYARWGWRPVGTARARPGWPVNDALVKP